jgi:hypothetical protein
LLYSGHIAAQSSMLPVTLDRVTHDYRDVDITTPIPPVGGVNAITIANSLIIGKTLTVNSTNVTLSATTITVQRLTFSPAVNTIHIAGTTRINCASVDFGTGSIIVQPATLPRLPPGPVKLIIEYTGSIIQGDLRPLDGVDVTIVKK